MVHVSFSLRKALFATTASVLALAAATPAVSKAGCAVRRAHLARPPQPYTPRAQYGE